MNREEMSKRMMDPKFGRSQMCMRSEKAQDIGKVKRIPRLQKALAKKARLLVVTELALPFNPMTGVEDENFNVDNKYRPPYSATSVALSLKIKANEDEVVKKGLMQRAGVTEWDTSNTEQFTEEDWNIFGRYRVPRIFTVPVVHINIPAMTKSDFGRDYEISVVYDESGSIVGEVPGVLKVNKLFRDKIYEEISEYQGKVDSGEIKVSEKDRKEAISKIFQKNPVSGVQPSNWLQMFELPLTRTYELADGENYNNFDAKAAEDCMVLTKYSKRLSTAMSHYTDGEYKKQDKYFDYFIFDMSCPSEGDDKTDYGRGQISLGTEYGKPGFPMVDEQALTEEQFKNFSAAITEFLDNGDKIEEDVRRSMYIQPYTDEVESQLYMSLGTVLDVEHDKYLTQRVIDANREVISLAFADKGDFILDEVDAGISDRKEGNLDEQEAATVAKEYNLESDEFALDEVMVE